jgi:hypothetical protein
MCGFVTVGLTRGELLAVVSNISINVLLASDVSAYWHSKGYTVDIADGATRKA